MGTWGPGLYQNDISEDVRMIFRDQLRRGKSNEVITQELINTYKEDILCSDNALDFWCALADTQWEMGRLLPYVREKALKCLECNDSAECWYGTNTKQVKKRKQVLDELQKKLHMPQPPEKKVAQYNPYICPWKEGDVFALPIVGDIAKDYGCEGHFLLIQKITEQQWHPVHTIPVVYLKIAKNIPDTLEEYNQLRFVRTWTTSVPLQCCGEKCYNERNFEKETDSGGFLHEYRIAVITTSKRTIPSQLRFVANYSNADLPRNEYIPVNRNNTMSINWRGLPSHALEFFYRYK